MIYTANFEIKTRENGRCGTSKMNIIKREETEDKKCSIQGSNLGPSACQADVITTTPIEQADHIHEKIIKSPTAYHCIHSIDSSQHHLQYTCKIFLDIYLFYQLQPPNFPTKTPVPAFTIAKIFTAVYRRIRDCYRLILILIL